MSSQSTEPRQSSDAALQAQPRKPRLLLIDVAKGFGILLIVLGHNIIFNQNFGFLADALASFRIPFFFFVSGVTLTLAGRSVKAVAIKRADAWLKPFIVVVTLFGLLKVVAGTGTIQGILVGLVFATGFTLVWPALWFLPHLWLVYIVCTWLLTSYAPFFANLYSRAAVLLALSVLGYYSIDSFSDPISNPMCDKQLHFSRQLFDCGLPFSADLLFVTSFYFLLGHFLSAAVKRFNPSLLHIGMIGTVFLVLCTLSSTPVDLNLRTYESLLLSPLQALCGIFLMLCLCYYCAQNKYVAASIGFFSRVSLFILLFHTPFLSWIIYHLPKWIPSQAVVGILGFVVPIAISVAIFYFVERTKVFAPLMFPRKSALPVR